MEKFTVDREMIEKALAFPEDGVVDIVIDSDAYNEVDDQFAIAWALRSPERLNVEAVYAAPFCSTAILKMMPPLPNGAPPITPEAFRKMLGTLAHFSSSPGEGMELSYKEILNLFSILEIPSDGRVFRGSDKYISDNDGKPVESEAARDLVRRAMAKPEGKRLYVLAIGAITNVASAILMEPKIRDKITVVWLSGQPPYYKNAGEFNLMQDMPASQIMFDSGVPLVLIPCMGVASHLTLTLPEIETLLMGKSKIGDYLGKIVLEAINPSPEAAAKADSAIVGYTGGMDDIPMEVHKQFAGRSKCNAWSRIIWDISTVGYMMSPNWSTSCLYPSPILNDDLSWSSDDSRHPIRLCSHVKRNQIFGDMFIKFEARP